MTYFLGDVHTVQYLLLSAMITQFANEYRGIVSNRNWFILIEWKITGSNQTRFRLDRLEVKISNQNSKMID